MTEPETATPIKDSERAASSIEEKGKEINIGSDSDSEDEESEAGKDEKTCSMDNLTRLKREKRLEMNRKSARERRKRKKMLIETLEQQVSELTKSNEKFRRDNQQLVLKVEDLSERLAKEEKELLLLRSITGNASESQLMTHHFSSPSSLGATSSMLTSLPSLPQGIGYDTTEASSTGDSLRRMFHAQGFNRASTASAAMGNNQGLAFGVAPNRAIDQEILCRIGRDPSAQALYDRMMPSNDVRSGLGTALQHQNAVSGTVFPVFESWEDVQIQSLIVFTFP